VGSFLEQHILGLVAQFSEVVNNVRIEYSAPEKKRCVKAVEELVKMAKTFTKIARPQVFHLPIHKHTAAHMEFGRFVPACSQL
jgi:hypothetical protein